MKLSLVAQPETISNPERDGLTRSDSDRRSEHIFQNLSRAARATSITLVGASFKTCALPLREALAERLANEPTRFRRTSAVREYAQLMTCNRIEIFMVTDSGKSAERPFIAWLSKTPGMRPGALYIRKDVEAIAHLFRVASGLDSMVLGEEQILSQVKDAGIAARTSRSSGGSLSALFDASVNVGTRMRAALKEMSSSGSTEESVSSVALRFALERLPHPPRSVLLVGTGKTSRLAASQLKGARLYVATRRASIPAFSRAKLVSHKELGRVAAKCDLIIAATKHSGYVLKKGELGGKKRRVILDLAFPRNIDPELRSGSTELYDLDDLARAFASRLSSPGPERRRAEQLVSAEAERFSRWLLASRQSSALSKVYRWAEGTRQKETEAALRRLPGLSERERRVVEAMSKRLVSKLLAPPTNFARSTSPELPQDQRLDVIQRVFEQGEG